MNLMDTLPIQTLLRAEYDINFKRLRDFTIVILHKGAPNDRRSIDGERIIHVQKDGFWYINRFGIETFIPAHRILELQPK